MNYEWEDEGRGGGRGTIRQGSRYHMILIYRIFLIGIKTQLKSVFVSGNVIIASHAMLHFPGKNKCKFQEKDVFHRYNE